MAAFNVSSVDLSSFGYPDNATFTDPMAAIWRSKPIVGPTSLQDIQNNILPLFAGLGAYPPTVAVEAALQAYHAANGAKLKSRNEEIEKLSRRKSCSSDDDDSTRHHGNRTESGDDHRI